MVVRLLPVLLRFGRWDCRCLFECSGQCRLMCSEIAVHDTSIGGCWFRANGKELIKSIFFTVNLFWCRIHTLRITEILPRTPLPFLSFLTSRLLYHSTTI